MELDPNLTPAERASALAIHKAKSAQMAIELSREVHLEEAIQKTANEMKIALAQALEQVFGEGDEKRDPEQMKILIRRIPLICQDIKSMHSDIADIKGNLRWGVRIVIAAVIIALLKLVLIP